jgi:hypothetical protein
MAPCGGLGVDGLLTPGLLRRLGKARHARGRLDRCLALRDVLPGWDHRRRNVASRRTAGHRPARRGPTAATRYAAPAGEIAARIAGVATVGRIAVELAPVDRPAPAPTPGWRAQHPQYASEQPEAGAGAIRVGAARVTAWPAIRPNHRTASLARHRTAGLARHRTAGLAGHRTAGLAGYRTAGLAGHGGARFARNAAIGAHDRPVDGPRGRGHAEVAAVRGVALGARSQRMMDQSVQQGPATAGVGYQRSTGQDGEQDPFHEIGPLD